MIDEAFLRSDRESSGRTERQRNDSRAYGQLEKYSGRVPVARRQVNKHTINSCVRCGRDTRDSWRGSVERGTNVCDDRQRDGKYGYKLHRRETETRLRECAGAK